MRNSSMRLKACLLAIGASLSLALPAFAEAPATPAAAAPGAQACNGDVLTLCAGIEKKDGGRARCLRANQAKLSPDCAKFVASRPPKWGQPLAAAAPAAAPVAAPAPAAPPAPAATPEKK